MAIITASGTKIYLGPIADESVDTTAEFSALTPYVEVKKVETYGEFGDEAAAVTFSEVGRGRIEKAKGAFDAGTLALTVGVIPNDPGQLAMIAAVASKFNFAVKLVLPDRLTDAGNGTTIYFRGLIMSRRLNVGGNDNVLRRAFNIGINSELYETAAT